MVISFFNLDQAGREVAREKLSGNTLRFFDGTLNVTDKEAYRDSDILCITPKSVATADVLRNCENLKYVVTRSTGTDHIDAAYCKEKGVGVMSAVYYGGISVAEYQFALLLNLTRKVSLAQETVKAKGFVKSGLQGTDLYGKTLGVIGYGNIGKKVETIARAFGMHVLISTRSRDGKDPKFVLLKDLLQSADVISLNIPLTDETYHMLDREAFQNMKDGVIILNTARGEVIDTDSLIEALESKKVKAAALDVVEGEQYLRGDFGSKSEIDRARSSLKALLSFDNVIVSPHVAYNSAEAVERILEETIDNIRSVL